MFETSFKFQFDLTFVSILLRALTRDRSLGEKVGG